MRLGTLLSLTLIAVKVIALSSMSVSLAPRHLLSTYLTLVLLLIALVSCQLLIAKLGPTPHTLHNNSLQSF